MKLSFNPFIALILGTCLAFSAHAGKETGFQVIVNPANEIDSLEQKDLAEVFLKKKTFWPNMNAILVVDLESSSDVRRQFSERVLSRPVSAVRNYWQQLLFSGRAVPPPEFRTEQEVISFVSSHPEAIGYVSTGADLRNLKTLSIKK